MITIRDDEEVITWRVGDVVVDLARAEPADVGTAVDLAQPDSISGDVAHPAAAVHHRSTRIGRRRHVLSPSWPSAIRLTNAFDTAKLIDARPGP